MDTPELSISIPHWTPQRLLSEACTNWNVRHAEAKDKIGPDCPWPLLVNAAHSFLRHNFTTYSQVVNSKNREELRNQIAVEVRKVYPWLVSDADPRHSGSPESREGKAVEPLKYFNALSRHSAELVGKRAALISALRGTSGEERRRLEAELTQVDQAAEQVQRQFLTVEQQFGKLPGSNKDTRLSFWTRPPERHQYWFLERKLYPCHLKDLGFACPRCTQRIWQTKRATGVGAGLKVFIASCHCLSVATSPDLRWTSLESWSCAVEDTSRFPQAPSPL
jgi:hypothetical protein